jgi:hypothetical protein
MPFELSAVSKRELRDVVDMLLKAYDHTFSFVNAVYPHRFTNCGIEGLDIVVGRLAYLWDVDPSVRWLKVTDTTTGNTVSASQWNVYDKEKPAEMMLDGPPGSWDSEADKKYAVEMFKSFITPRWTRYREANVPIICKFGISTNLATTNRSRLEHPGNCEGVPASRRSDVDGQRVQSYRKRTQCIGKCEVRIWGYGFCPDVLTVANGRLPLNLPLKLAGCTRRTDMSS